MGGCLSCWGRRKKQSRDEHQPLLPPDEPPISSGLQNVSQCLGALAAGKLPSEAQLESILRSALNSGILADDTPIGYGPLSERGKHIIRDLNELIEAVLQMGMEKNNDDVFQEAYFEFTKLDRHSANASLSVQSRSDDLDLDAIKGELPDKAEVQADTRVFLRSVRTLLSLFISSSAFRLLLSDIFITSREILADTAARVGAIAKDVEDQASKAEHGLRPNGAHADHSPPADQTRDTSVKADFPASGDADKNLNEISEETPARIRSIFLQRWEELLDRACQNPSYRTSLLTILSLLEKYYTLAYSTASKVPSTSDGDQAPVVVDSSMKIEPELAAFLSHLKTVLERMAQHKSLDPFFEQAHTSLGLLAASPDQLELRAWLEDVGRYLQRALNDPQKYRSYKIHAEAEALYDRAQEILHSDKHSEWVIGSKRALEELDVFLSAAENDKSTRRLLRASEGLLTDTGYLLRLGLGLGANMQKQIRREIRQDLFGWFLPRFLRLIGAIPMPRVEVSSPRLDAVIDSLVLTSPSASLLPDHVHLQILEELRLDMSDQSSTPSGINIDGTSTHLRMKLHLDGTRVSARGISYYVDVKGPAFLGWRDNGLLDVQVGKVGRTGQGIELDLDLDTDIDVEHRSVFRARDVKLDMPGLTFRIDHSRHWLVNKLILQWVAGPTVRQILSSILSGQLQSLLEVVDTRLFNIYERASEMQGDDTEPSFSDYWQAALEELSNERFFDENAPGAEDAVSEVTITQTQATLTGLLHTSTAQENPGSPDAPEPSTTQIAVGVGEQILPGKGGPVLEEESPADVARETVYELEQSLEQGKAALQQTGREAMQSREQALQAQKQMERTQQKERRRTGWRSAAFDL